MRLTELASEIEQQPLAIDRCVLLCVDRTKYIYFLLISSFSPSTRRVLFEEIHGCRQRLLSDSFYSPRAICKDFERLNNTHRDLRIVQTWGLIHLMGWQMHTDFGGAIGWTRIWVCTQTLAHNNYRDSDVSCRVARLIDRYQSTRFDKAWRSRSKSVDKLKWSSERKAAYLIVWGGLVVGCICWWLLGNIIHWTQSGTLFCGEYIDIYIYWCICPVNIFLAH